ncbi:MAG: hypothetical protein M1837_003624 [Sclerophora amabilis]|nr:MAG: hypothetical protein M1837_003624 [Sclerophora amabilis]
MAVATRLGDREKARSWKQLKAIHDVDDSEKPASSTEAAKSTSAESETESSASGTITAKPTASATDSPSSSDSTSGESASESDSESDESGSKSGTKTASGKKGSKGSKGSKTTEFIDPRLPAGGIQMVTPAVISGPQFYKIGANVTLAWNYTSLSVTPSAIDIMASCSEDNEPFAIKTNATVEPTGSLIWDTKEYEATADNKLSTCVLHKYLDLAVAKIDKIRAEYTLIIYDSTKDVSSTPKAGHLGVFNQFTFGMYLPRDPTPLKDWVCASCNSALSDSERHALGFMAAMVTITVLSFTWFVSGVGVI